jgi:pimeloyl-ACP methyl ester carboxylesterase
LESSIDLTTDVARITANQPAQRRSARPYASTRPLSSTRRLTMSVQNPTAKRQHRTPASAEPVAKRRRGAGSTIAASALVGAVAALVLVLVAFPGATEAATTGMVLVGFAVGWALMGLLTVGRTREPQRWAYVPATVMGLIGAALVVSAPGDSTMTAMNWVWPPVMAALAVWMFAQVRRSVTGKAWWVLYPVISVLVLVSLGATYANVKIASNDIFDTAPGTLYDVGGHRLHLDCRGRGTPTVVLSNGLGGVSAGWARVAGPISATTRVCAYDRAGQGWSDETDSPRDGVESAEALHTLLAAAGEQGPYVLVGHSTGGTYALTYAARYPEEVAGLVLLDSASPEQFTQMPAYESQYPMMRRLYGVLPTLNRLGLGQLLPGTSHLPATDAETVDTLATAPRYSRNQRDEVSVIPELFTQAQALTTLGDQPLAVLTASETSDGTEGWDDAQDALAGLSTNAVRRTVDSTHMGLLEDPAPVEESVRAIAEVISSVRTGTPLPHQTPQPRG